MDQEVAIECRIFRVPDRLPVNRLPVSYHLCTTHHTYGAKAVRGAAAA